MNSFRLDDYELEGPIGSSLGTFIATEKQNPQSDGFILKRITFSGPQERSVCINHFQLILKSLMKGINVPRSFSLENVKGSSAADDSTMSLLSARKEGSLKDDIEKRTRERNFFSSLELRSMMEYSLEQLLKMSSGNLHHMNIKPSNLLRNIRGDYSFAECGYPSVNKSIDNDVFRSPQFLQHLSKKKSMTSLSDFDRESLDIFSLGMCYL